MTLAGHPFDTAKVRLQSQSSTNPIYCKSLTQLAVHTRLSCNSDCKLNNSSTAACDLGLHRFDMHAWSEGMHVEPVPGCA